MESFLYGLWSMADLRMLIQLQRQSTGHFLAGTASCASVQIQMAYRVHHVGQPPSVAAP